MKKISTILTAFIITLSLFAQAPQKMSYQAVIRDAAGNLVVEKEVGMRVSILLGSADGVAIYSETHTPTTNANGLVSLEIGMGSTSDNFSDVDWSEGFYFIKTESDPTGGMNYTITGVSQILSVPYAFHATTAEVLVGEINETDPLFTSWDKSDGIVITENQIEDLQDYIIDITNESIANLSDIDTTGVSEGKVLKYNAKSDQWLIADDLGLIEETDPLFTAWDKDYNDLINRPVAISEFELDGNENQIKNIADPADPQDAATKAYVDVLKEMMVELKSDIEELQLIMEGNLPSVITANVTEITFNSAKSGGNVIEDGGSDIITRGIVWSNSNNPSTNNHEGKTNDGDGIGEFISVFTNLSPSTKYFVRAYATNYYGTAYGEQIEFTTNSETVSSSAFISTWKTDNDGESNNDQIKLPLSENGDYDFFVDWGDGTESHITSYDQQEVTHTYAAPGIYTIMITEVIAGWRFNNGGDKLKILEISQWGNLMLGNEEGYFLGCENLKITTTDTINLDGLNIKQLFDAGIMVGTLEQSGASIDDLVSENLIGFVEDVQGVSHKWIRIGDQYWFAENLKSNVYSDGTPIPNGWNISYELLSNSDEPEYSFIAEKSEDNFYKYGRLYTGWAVYNQDKNVCPDGWHVSSDTDWQTLNSYINSKGYGSATTYHIRDKTYGVWNATNHDKFTNASGFTARPGGQRLENYFNNVGTHSYYWVQPPGGETYGSLVTLSTVANAIQVLTWEVFMHNHFSFSVRCVKD